MVQLRKDQLKEERTAYLLLCPTFILIFGFMYYPPIMGIVRSLFFWAPAQETRFIGLKNFSDYFSSRNTALEWRNMLIFLLAEILTGALVPFLAAELIFHVVSTTFRNIYKRLVMLPMVLPAVVVVLLWKHVYDPNLGPVNVGLRAIGLEGLTHFWLEEPGVALFSIIMVGFPWICALGTLIFLGGLQQIPEAFFHAARIEGASALQILRYVEIPLLKRQFKLQLTLASITGITHFNKILLMTNGGPGSTTMVPGLSMYKRAFQFQQFGMASGIGFLIFLTALIVTVVINLSTRDG